MKKGSENKKRQNLKQSSAPHTKQTTCENQLQVLSQQPSLKKELCAACQQKYKECGGMNHFSVACSSLKVNKQQNMRSVHSVEPEFKDFHEVGLWCDNAISSQHISITRYMMTPK